jgi:phosphatidylethanolamine-binding protein (PEBP) family uncharacterized protein
VYVQLPAGKPFAERRHVTRFQTLQYSTLFLFSLLPLGCGDDSDSESPTPPPAAMALTSPSIQSGQPLSDQFTCEAKAFGDGTSPELDWTDGPSGTQSYAILLKDKTIEAGMSAGDMNPEHPFHWTIWNISGSTRSLPASLTTVQSPIAGTQQQNGGPPFIAPGSYGYFGPCPNLGTAAFAAPAEVHDDAFILYAFSAATITPPAYDPGPDPMNPLNPVRQLANFFESHPNLLAKAELAFTSDATPATCPGFPNPPFACAPASP